MDPPPMPKSFTFISAKLEDNPILMGKDPGYLANLMAQDIVTRERLLKGNWKIRPTAGTVFRREWFSIVDAVPRDKITQTVRYWDLAATIETEKNKNPDFTASLKLSKDVDGVLYIENVLNFRDTSLGVKNAVLNTASIDGREVAIGIEQEPGASGKSVIEDYVRSLIGYDVAGYRPTGSKVARARPASAQAEAGNIKLVRGMWNESFLNQCENFDGDPRKKDDQVDCLSGAVDMQSGMIAPVVDEDFSVDAGDWVNTSERPDLERW